MTNALPLADRIKVGHLSPQKPNPFEVKASDKQRAAIALLLDIIDLPKFSFTGQIVACGADAWQLTGVLDAHVVQSCVVTLEPVKTVLHSNEERIYSPHLRPPEDEEVEMPDDALEPLGQFIDLGAVAIEALSLALPQYPRAKGAELADQSQDLDESDAEPGRRPFADLDKLLKSRPE